MSNVVYEKNPIVVVKREFQIENSKFIFAVFITAAVLNVTGFMVAFFFLSGMAQLIAIFANVLIILIALGAIYFRSTSIARQTINLYSDYLELSKSGKANDPESEKINYNEISHVHFSRTNRLSITDLHSRKLQLEESDALAHKEKILELLKSGGRLFSILNEDHTLTYSREIAPHLFLQDPNSDIRSLTITRNVEGDFEVVKNDRDLIAYIEIEHEKGKQFPSYYLYDSHSENLVLYGIYRDLIIEEDVNLKSRIKLDLYDAEELMISHAVRSLTDKKFEKILDIQVGNDRLQWNMERVVFEEIVLSQDNTSKNFNVKFNPETKIYRIDSDNFVLPTYLSMMFALMAVAVYDYYPAQLEKK